MAAENGRVEPAREPRLEEKAALVIGSSEGIGATLASRLAAAGAQVVLRGQGEVLSPVLNGSRLDDMVGTMVARAVSDLGRLDILIDASGPPDPDAVSPSGSAWRVPLLVAYLSIEYALPHLIRAGGGHVVVCSPPIRFAETQFARYYSSRFGMTRLAMCVAREWAESNVAANTLWPAASIDQHHGPNEPSADLESCRHPETLREALIGILRQRPRDCTGRQLLDEEFLREQGWSQEDVHACSDERGPGSDLALSRSLIRPRG